MSKRPLFTALLASLALTAQLVFSPGPVAADARVIAYDEAVRIGLERNSDLRQAAIAAQAGSVAVDQARSRFLPDLRCRRAAARASGATSTNPKDV